MENNTFKLYNNTVTLEFDPEKHIYTVDGRRIEGVTGVTGVINKPALMYWAVNMAVLYLKKVWKPGKSYDEIQIKKILDGAKLAHRAKKTEAGDIGTLVHESIETYIKTGKITKLIHPKAKECFKQFLGWAKGNKVKFIESERKIYSKKYGYAGTMDFYCQIGDKRFVGDTKTSTAIYDEMWLQTSAYQEAYTEETGVRTDGQVIVRVGKDGSLEVRENYDYDKNFPAFAGALVLYRRIQEFNDAKKGGEYK